MKKMILYLSLSMTTLTFVACANTDNSSTTNTHTKSTTQTDTVKTISYKDINQVKQPETIITSIEQAAHDQPSYGKVPYEANELRDALDEKFQSQPDIPNNLPKVVAVLITKKGCTTCHRLEKTLAPAFMEASSKMNDSLGVTLQENIYFEVQDDGNLPDWLTAFVLESGYSLDKIAVPSLMYMTYLKDTNTDTYKWVRFDQASTSLSEETAAIDRANLVYDTYFDTLPNLYQENFSTITN